MSFFGFDIGWASALGAVTLFALQVASVLAVLLRPSERRSSALAWIILIFVLPVAGVLIYWTFGTVWVASKRRHDRAEKEALAAAASRILPQLESSLPDRFQPLARLAALMGGQGVRPGNHITVTGNSDRAITWLVRDIDAAQRSCSVLSYIFLTDRNASRVAEALAAAARRGLACRLLVDGLGSRGFLRSGLCRRLRQDGVQVVEALPLGLLGRGLSRIDLRNHRKLWIVDSNIAYTGSQNIADADFAPKADYAPWIDVMLRIEGPIARDLEAVFARDWYLDAGRDLPAAPEPAPTFDDGVPLQIIATGPGTENDALVQLFQASFHLARRELILTTPYFVPDDGTVAALRTAAARGVRTLLVVPARNDSPLVHWASRSFYELLLAAGVEIHEFSGGLLHAKTLTVDGALAIVTTANMDRRSFELNYEISTAAYDPDLALHLRDVQNGYLDQSQPIELDTWRDRNALFRVAENAAGIFAPIL